MLGLAYTRFQRPFQLKRPGALLFASAPTGCYDSTTQRCGRPPARYPECRPNAIAQLLVDGAKIISTKELACAIIVSSTSLP